MKFLFISSLISGIIILYGAAITDNSSYAATPLIQQTNANMKIELELPDSLEVGKSSVFNIRFLDDQNFSHGHVDYRYRILKEGVVTSSSQTIHSESGITSFLYDFDSSGSYEVIIEIEGILFQPISPEIVKFSVEVTPEFSISTAAAISGMSILIVVLVRRIRA